MEKVIQKLIDWRDAWGNGRPFNPEFSGARPYTFEEFFGLATKSVVLDGGTFDSNHNILSFPPDITGCGWIEIGRDEIYNKIWN